MAAMEEYEPEEPLLQPVAEMATANEDAGPPDRCDIVARMRPGDILTFAPEMAWAMSHIEALGNRVQSPAPTPDTPVTEGDILTEWCTAPAFGQ